MPGPPLNARDPAHLKPGKRSVTYPYGDLRYARIIEARTRNKTATGNNASFLKPYRDEQNFPSCLLVAQQSDPGDDNLENVTDTYESLPGPLFWKPGFNTELGCATSEYRQRVAMPSAANSLGGTIVSPQAQAQIVVDSYVQPIDGSAILGERITECWSLPPSRTELESIGFEFPAQFVFHGAWSVPPPGGITTPGPYPGVNFDLTGHRTMSTPASVDISYSNGPTGFVPTIGRVVTPGVADRFFGIGPNTIHNAIFIQEVNGATTQIVEDLGASTPTSYTPGDILTIRAGERLLKGTIWEKRIYSVAE